MMSHPAELASFIADLPRRLRADESLELVIAGDFIDFLAIELDAEDEAWTPSPERAVAKLHAAMDGHDAPVYEALRGFVRAGHSLTVMVGNHDLEIAIPAVQQQLCKDLGVTRHQVVFVDDGEAWRIGRALFEHGNRYDGANLNDWEGIRATVSAWSRGETPPEPLEVSAGSRLVAQVVNPLKRKRYSFLDLLQPQGELIGYLLLAIEPTLKYDFKSLRHLMVGGIRRAMARKVGPPRAERNVASRPADDVLVGRPLDTRHLDELLGVEPISPAEKQVSARDLIREFLRNPGDNLEKFLVSGQRIPLDRLAQIQGVIAAMVCDDDSLNPAGATEQYGRNAERLRASGGVDVVVMGHTHKPRHVGDPDHASYINTGTWIDSITVPPETLQPGDEGLARLQRWLSDLYHDRGVRSFRPHWADLRIEADGEVSEARLCPAEART